MKLYIKQKVFTLGERFYVKDEFGTDQYYVEGSFFRYPKQFKIYNMKNELVSQIDRQMMKLLPHYNIQTSRKSLTIKQNLTFLKMSFSILNSDWKLQGDYFGHNYSIISGNKPLMHLSKHWFTWGDSYELNIIDPDDAILCLSIAVVVDAALVASQD